jgi:hypothetical protein
MNQESNVPLNNLQIIKKHIEKETEVKIAAIQRDANQIVEMGRLYFYYL